MSEYYEWKVGDVFAMDTLSEEDYKFLIESAENCLDVEELEYIYYYEASDFGWVGIDYDSVLIHCDKLSSYNSNSEVANIVKIGDARKAVKPDVKEDPVKHPSKKPKLLIVGTGRHGKDTVAEALRDAYGYTFKSSSEAFSEFGFSVLSELLGYKTPEEAFEDRHNHRALLYQLIAAYNHHDKARIAKEILKDNDIYVGMRSKEEIEECRKQGIFDLIIWVDASNRVDYVEDEDSCDITKEDADIIILNNGTLAELLRKVDVLAKLINKV